MWLKRTAILFLALGCVSVGAVFLIDWFGPAQEALVTPINLQPRFSLTRTFRVPSKASYNIELRCARSLPFEKLKKLLQGGNVVSISLLEDRAPVALYPYPEPVFRPGIVSTAEDGNLGFARDWISQDIASFHGDPNKLYTITCSVIRPVEELSSTHPTLIVQLAPIEIESGAFGIFLLYATAALFFIMSGVLWIIFFCLRYRAGKIARLRR